MKEIETDNIDAIRNDGERDEVIWSDFVNRKKIILRPGEIARGKDFRQYARPHGPLTLVIDESKRRDTKGAGTKIPIDDICEHLSPYYQAAYRAKFRGRTADTMPPLTGLLRAPKARSRFINSTALAAIRNNTSITDPIEVVAARLVDHAVMRKEIPRSRWGQRKQTALTLGDAGRPIYKESWRHGLVAEGIDAKTGLALKRDAFFCEPWQPHTAAGSEYPTDISAWAAILAQPDNFNLVIDLLAEAIVQSVKNSGKEAE